MGGEIRCALTLANLSVALGEAGLWRYVGAVCQVGDGNLEFLATDVDALTAELRRHRGFTTPRAHRPFWQSRQRRRAFALHLKHFPGWPPQRVQAHIDPVGLWWPPWAWLVPGLPLLQATRHLLDHDGYKDVARIASRHRHKR